MLPHSPDFVGPKRSLPTFSLVNREPQRRTAKLAEAAENHGCAAAQPYLQLNCYGLADGSPNALVSPPHLFLIFRSNKEKSRFGCLRLGDYGSERSLTLPFTSLPVFPTIFRNDAAQTINVRRGKFITIFMKFSPGIPLCADQLSCNSIALL